MWAELHQAEIETGSVFVKDFAYRVEHDLTDGRLTGMTHTFSATPAV